MVQEEILSMNMRSASGWIKDEIKAKNLQLNEKNIREEFKIDSTAG